MQQLQRQWQPIAWPGAQRAQAQTVAQPQAQQAPTHARRQVPGTLFHLRWAALQEEQRMQRAGVLKINTNDATKHTYTYTYL